MSVPTPRSTPRESVSETLFFTFVVPALAALSILALGLLLHWLLPNVFT